MIGLHDWKLTESVTLWGLTSPTYRCARCGCYRVDHHEGQLNSVAPSLRAAADVKPEVSRMQSEFHILYFGGHPYENVFFPGQDYSMSPEDQGCKGMMA